VADEVEACLLRNGRAVPFLERLAVQRDGAARHVEPGVNSRGKSVLPLVALEEPRHPKRNVLLDLDGAVPPVLRGEPDEALAGSRRVEGLLVVAGGEPARVRHHPDLQEVHGLRLRCVVLAVGDARARPHELVIKEPVSIARTLAAVGEASEVPRRSPGRGPPYWKSQVLRRQVLEDEQDCGSPGDEADEAA
jgi:hypothetical protein